MIDEDDERRRDYDDYEEFYHDWLDDHISQLRRDYCDDHEDDFNEYCRKEFDKREE